eukprot:gene8642-5407_t
MSLHDKTAALRAAAKAAQERQRQRAGRKEAVVTKKG